MRLVMRDGREGLADGFAQLPALVYRDDPLWIPEEEEVLRQAFDTGNPWFARGRAATLSIPCRARLAVFRDRACTIDGRPAAFFGYWEHHADSSASELLFAEAEAWARDHGADALYGPVNFTTLGNYRVRLSAEPNALPFPGEPYNPRAYGNELRSLGYEVVRGYHTQVGTAKGELLGPKIARRRALTEAGYTFAPIDGERWLSLLPELHRVVDEVFGESFGYIAVDFDTFTAACGQSIASRLSPNASVLAHAPDGTLAGFLLVYPHYGSLVVQGAGPLRVPVSRLSFAEHAPRLDRAGERTGIVKTVGVTRAHRQRGLMDALGVTALERGRVCFDRWLAAMIRTDNPSGRFGRSHADGERTYALYGKMLHDARA